MNLAGCLQVSKCT